MGKKVKSFLIRVHELSPAGPAEPLELELSHSEAAWVADALRQMLKFKASRMVVDSSEDRNGDAFRKMSVHVKLEEVTDHMRLHLARSILEGAGYVVTKETPPEEQPS